MRTNLLFSPKQFNYLLLITFLFFLSIPSLFLERESEKIFFFAAFFFQPISNLNIIGLFLGIICVGYCLYLINLISKKIVFLNKSKLFSSWFFLLSIGYLEDSFHFSSTLLAFLLMLISIKKITELYQIKEPEFKIFDIGLIMGFSYIINPSFLLFILLGISALMIYSHKKLRYLSIYIIGLILPIILYISIAYLTNISINYNLLLGINIHPITSSSNLIAKGAMCYLYFISALCFFELLKNLNKKKIQSRKFNLLLLVYLGLCFLFSLLYPNSEELIVYSTFLAFSTSNYFIYCSNKWHNHLILIFFFLGAIFNQYSLLINFNIF